MLPKAEIAHWLFAVRPRLERGEQPRGVGRSLSGESTIAMAVLLAAAVLVNGAPPPVAGGSEAALPAAVP